MPLDSILFSYGGFSGGREPVQYELQQGCHTQAGRGISTAGDSTRESVSAAVQ